ncbi:hypothetical protein EJ04DRAFT_581062 [Polyplosphaeria fusca]|uniref:Uncharacterized protein n=1 Tax=Polyplosphaeria fusca TaxID=682080 RepID=A0A9P4QLQ5_9PLEO|nr:hypothetical protein EJ04DRAFT_581062 [Polyplosphaeria fusca]
MLGHILISGLVALSALSSVVHSAPSYVRHEDGTVVFTVEHRSEDGNGDVEKRRIWLNQWVGCSSDQQQQITDSWKSMLQMAEQIKGKIDFDEAVARDFLGDSKKNSAQQKVIRGLIEHVTTWQLGGVLDWHLAMYCNDYLKKRADIGAAPGEGCPGKTLPEDYDKCRSKCWQLSNQSNGGVPRWRYRGLAYTENWRSTHIGAMNWCPGWFAQPTCLDAYQRNIKLNTEQRINMVNYQCREQAMVHELFHLDMHSSRVPNAGHVLDRKMHMRDFSGNIVSVLAYGPLYTKVLANWSKDVGRYVATNADNLAFYFLGKWIQETGGFYPEDPRTNDGPQSIPNRRRTRRDVTPDVYDPIQIVDGQVSQGDPNDLVSALGVNSTDEAETEFEYQDDEDDCDDLTGVEDGSVPSVCQPGNDPLDLDGSIPFPPNQAPPGPGPPTETATSPTPGPAVRRGGLTI